jgi:hypothetical protein
MRTETIFIALVGTHSDYWGRSRKLDWLFPASPHQGKQLTEILRDIRQVPLILEPRSLVEEMLSLETLTIEGERLTAAEIWSVVHFPLTLIRTFICGNSRIEPSVK